MNVINTLVSKKATRKFKELDHYDQQTDTYHLMPFRFIKLNAEQEILVNDIGDYLIVPRGTAFRIVKRLIDKHTEQELYADLLANFIISETSIPPLLNVVATRYRTKKSFLDHFTALHIFVISLRCEHTCHYCQVSRVSEDKASFDMSFAYLDKGIDMMMQSPNPHVTMEFQGGEALLAFEKIKYAVVKAKAMAELNNKQISFVICTNLAPVTEEILAFCKEYSILISTSLDGPDYIHNKNRHRKGNNSYELALRGIEMSRNVLGADMVSALLTTTNLSLQYPDEIVDEYFHQGFKNIFLRPISPYGFATKNEKKNHYDMSAFLQFYKRALQRIIAYNKEGHFFREDYAAIILRKIFTPFPVGYVDLQSPAGMINSVIVFNYNGKVYATDESRMLAEMNDNTFELGHLDTHAYEDIFYGTKSQEFAQVWSNESLPGCSECAFQTYCGADPVFNYATQGSLVGHRPTSAFCQKNMTIIRHLFELMQSDPSVETIFKSWITGVN